MNGSSVLRLFTKLAAVLAVTAPARAARAFPDFAAATATRTCTVCHHAPAGGGLLNDWGRSEAGEALSLGGDGAFLHGAVTLPEWLSLGGSFRVAALAAERIPGGVELAAFPMQADLMARVGWRGLFATVTVGGRGTTRFQRSPAWTYVVSREHYLGWSHPAGVSVRGGRFFPPAGLRLPDHTLWIRRYTGLGLLEEPYALGFSLVRSAVELHATGFLHDPLLDVGRRESGGTLMAEVHSGPLAVGVTGRAAAGLVGLRVLGGVHVRVSIPPARLVMLAEVDAIWERLGELEAGGADRWQIVAYAGAYFTPTRGLRLWADYERYDEHLGTPATARNGAGAGASFFPTAHLELGLHGRFRWIGPEGAAYLGMLQVHYYL